MPPHQMPNTSTQIILHLYNGFSLTKYFGFSVTFINKLVMMFL